MLIDFFGQVFAMRHLLSHFQGVQFHCKTNSNNSNICTLQLKASKLIDVHSIFFFSVYHYNFVMSMSMSHQTSS